jgi:hypothetical protein
MILSALFSGAADLSEADSIRTCHEHKTFHAEFNPGISFGKIENHGADFSIHASSASIRCLSADFRIGFAINRKVILTYDYLRKPINAPGEFLGQKNSGIDVMIGDITNGIGISYYTSGEYFCSITAGIGHFVVLNGSKLSRSKDGISSQLRFGKYWWIAPQWGISAGLSYGFTSVSYKNEQLRSDDSHVISSQWLSINTGISFR